MNLPASMRHVAVREPGGADMLSAVDAPVPVPKPGEELMRVAWAGVNRPDVAQRAGNYPPPADASPILGLEVSGTVAACAADVAQWKVGDRVCSLVAGGHSSKAMAMSTPIRCWMSIDVSGERKCADPSM